MQVTGSCGVSPTAMAQMRDRQFSRADSDRSGGLSLEEFASATRRRPAALAQAQANSAAAPAASAVRDAFGSLDSNGDGQVSAAEMAAAQRPPPSGGFDSASFAALLGSQGGSDEARPGGRTRGHRHHASQEPPNQDTAAQRQLSAYNARQPATPATAITA